MIDGKYGVEFLKEKEMENHQDKQKNITSGSDDFAQAIARIAVAQICESLGYQSFQQSALDTLSDVGVRYIREIGKNAMCYANLTNRNECNVFDVIQGLEDLGSVQGFSGASDYNHCLSGSGVVRDIIRYVYETEEFPFAHSIPTFPVVKGGKLYTSFAQIGENPPNEYIPSWLPMFPDPETCVHINSRDKKEVEFAVESKVEERHMKVDRSLLNLQPKLICDGLETGLADGNGYAAKAQRTVESNPFLAPPLQLEEKDVSLPMLPAKLSDEATSKCQNHAVFANHVSILEPYAPATEEIGTHSCQSTQDRRKVPLNGRNTVKFKLGSSRKCSGTEMSPWNEGIEKVSLWFGVD
ncbi:transcription initiation factor TFIID subunit 8-like [Olea europaea var. sylvestris]|uniref:transcription initiation factor TFIID subunit 8-like n=1 Tax=Olea europaea var. sylvestris TaxID=158386 RepID=UPI000C1CD181|nr:transcription initiation factor TFIID subunit 8-like [Olea europaea var. sylvestris]XP_022879475.1 transcription initiation factor TFIID subunit 8-like [Olea europaea var. sylvestris]XP_022879476.1 transcription initiation factor TFIID subunit 8-like [Olea europaea var. sylvestris]XP_022879477.1 transcription initiation factor TFIID subunit 8-like [Olea europaea var. sylvestris]XP_022879478.1 transcription initiation factor TFIID subunit 8-like [Olea europaea var. sylvestris]